MTFKRSKTVYMYDKVSYELVGTMESIADAVLQLGTKFKIAYKYPKGYIIDDIIYSTIPCPYTEFSDRARYFSPDNDYIKVHKSSKQVATELRGSRIYIYDVVDKAYLGYYGSISEASFDMGVPLSTLIKGTREYPEGYTVGDTIYSRTKLHKGDI